LLQDKARIVDRASFDRVLDEQELSVSALADTSSSIELGRLLAANRVLTGRILPFGDTMVIFARLIDVETTEVVAIAQVTITMSEEISALL
jgi:curli biogenesis system outer membrane secretion channel CsgG